ncbi:MAG TPA: FUSC family protein [Pseudonocardia sp.]|nr:FUSC family protein [Pseudonocardia sp.]
MAVIMLLVIAAAAGLGVLVGLGAAAVLAALSAMFCLMASFGGTLRADLRLLAWFGPLLIVVVGGLKSLAGVAPWPAIVLVTVVVFGVGLLPVLGTRFVTVGMGLGMAATFACGFQQGGPFTLLQDFAGPAVAVVVVVVVRVLMGMKDPDQSVRAALAGALTAGPGAAPEQAVQQWRADGPRAWTTAVLGGVLRYHNALRVLNTRRGQLSGPAVAELDQVLAAANEEAGRLAGQVSEKTAAAPTDRVRRAEPRIALPGATRELVTSVWLGLEAIQAAVANRDRAEVALPAAFGRDQLTTELRGALTWDSAQLRHAVRCALGMLLALSISMLWASSPLRLSFLLAVFAIMQPQLQDSIRVARQRAYGSLAGAAALALLIVLVDLPQPALVPIGIGAMLIGMLFFMQKNPLVFNACTILMSVGLNVNMRHLEIGPTLLQYLGQMALAVGIALAFGFVAIPGVPKPTVAVRFNDAVRDARELVHEVAAALVNRNPDAMALRPRFRAATGAHQNLRATDSVSPEPTAEQQLAAEQASEALQGLSASMSALLMRAAASAPLADAVAEVALQLDPHLPPDPARVDGKLPAVIDPEQRLLVDTMIASTITVAQSAPILRATN